MSALGHYLEAAGLPTTLISLVRPHTEKIQPPRALWVPYELGRPLGAPRNPAFQTSVLRAVLALLERPTGPVILEDFDIDPPGMAGIPDWRGPETTPAASGDYRQALPAEVAQLLPGYQRTISETGRTTVGILDMALEDLASFVASFADGLQLASPVDTMSAPQALRFAADDLKAFYMETASGTATPSSEQLNRWFWTKTVAGHALNATRIACEQSDDEQLKRYGANLLVPQRWRQQLTR